ncbi:MAG: NAD(P)/FAD-dependent oxidoreductase, partial [bacterium]|nr:NAD(P)/FAD-dependent oxidoreductase [bacterium]
MAKKNIVVLGAGTGGTIISNMLRRYLPVEDWSITVIDRDNQHIYQPGLLFVPFGLEKPKKLVKPRNKYILPNINFVIDEITRID